MGVKERLEKTPRVDKAQKVWETQTNRFSRLHRALYVPRSNVKDANAHHSVLAGDGVLGKDRLGYHELGLVGHNHGHGQHEQHSSYEHLHSAYSILSLQIRSRYGLLDFIQERKSNFGFSECDRGTRRPISATIVLLSCHRR